MGWGVRDHAQADRGAGRCKLHPHPCPARLFACFLEALEGAGGLWVYAKTRPDQKITHLFPVDGGRVLDAGYDERDQLVRVRLHQIRRGQAEPPEGLQGGRS